MVKTSTQLPAGEKNGGGTLSLFLKLPSPRKEEWLITRALEKETQFSYFLKLPCSKEELSLLEEKTCLLKHSNFSLLHYLPFLRSSIERAEWLWKAKHNTRLAQADTETCTRRCLCSDRKTVQTHRYKRTRGHTLFQRSPFLRVPQLIEMPPQTTTTVDFSAPAAIYGK